MEFPIERGQLHGIIRRYATRGSPKIELFPSSSQPAWPVNNILQYEDDSKHWVTEMNDGLDAHLVIKIQNCFLMIKNYSFQSHFSEEHFVQSWTFEGSNDNIHYDMLDDQPQNEYLKNGNIKSIEVNPEKRLFKYFRLKNKMNTISGHANMRVTHIELFGTLYLPRQSCKKPNNKPISKLFRYIIVFCLVSH